MSVLVLFDSGLKLTNEVPLSNIFKISKTFLHEIYFILTLIALIAALVMRIILALEMGGFISISEKSLKEKEVKR